MRTTTIFAETHTSERANHVAYRLVCLSVCRQGISKIYERILIFCMDETWSKEDSLRFWRRSGFFHGSWIIFFRILRHYEIGLTANGAATW